MLTDVLDDLVIELRGNNFDRLSIVSQQYPEITTGLLKIDEIEYQLDTENYPSTTPELKGIVDLYLHLENREFKEAIEVMEQLDLNNIHPLLQLVTCLMGFSLYMFVGSTPKLTEMNEMAFEINEELDIMYYHCKNVMNKGTLFQFLGKQKEAVSQYESLMEESVNFPILQNQLYLTLAGSYNAQMNFSKSLEILDKLSEEQDGVQNYEIYSLQGAIFYKRGYLVQAENYVRKALKTLSGEGKEQFSHSEIELKFLLSSILISQGELSNASRVLNQIEVDDNVYYRAIYLHYLGIIDLQRGNIDDSFDEFEESSEFFRQFNANHMIAETMMQKAKFYLEQHPEMMKDLVNQAFDIARNLNEPLLKLKLYIDYFDILHKYASKEIEHTQTYLIDIYMELSALVRKFENDFPHLQDLIIYKYSQILDIKEEYADLINVLNELLDNVRSRDDFLLEIQIHNDLGRTYLLLNDLAKAEHHYLETYKKLHNAKYVEILVETLYGLLKIFLAKKDEISSLKTLEQIKEISSQGEYSINVQHLATLGECIYLVDQVLLSDKFRALPLLERLIESEVIRRRHKITAYLILIKIYAEELLVVSSDVIRIRQIKFLRSQVEQLQEFVEENLQYELSTELEILSILLDYLLSGQEVALEKIVSVKEGIKTKSGFLPEKVQFWENRISEDNVTVTHIAAYTTDMLQTYEKVNQVTIGEYSKYDQIKEQQHLELLGRVMASISHEFNNILAVTLGSVTLLEKTISNGKTEENMEVLRTITNVSNKAAELIRNIKKLSQNERQDLTETNFGDSVVNLLELIKISLPNHIKLKTHIEDDLYVKANDFYLNQIVFNLVLNAKDAMTSGGNIFISVTQDSDHAKLIVRDEGIGMDEHTLMKLYEPFYTTKGKGGTGLGLFNVMKSVLNLDGSINVSSELGEGTEFEVLIPLSQRTDGGPQPDVHRRIYVKIDQDDFSHLLVRMLRVSGYKFDAIEILDENNLVKFESTDILIIEAPMDDIAKWRQDQPDLTIFAIVDLDEKSDILSLEKMNIDFIKKPFEIDNFIARIESLF